MMAKAGKLVAIGIGALVGLALVAHLYIDHLSFHAMQESQVALSRLIVKLHELHPELFEKAQ